MKTNHDYKMATLVGLTASVLWFFALQHLGLIAEKELFGLLLLLPVLYIAGIAIATYIIPKEFFHKAIKFLMVGILNTGIDFFIFNTFIALTGIDSGAWVLAFKSISFLAALINSYELNRLWTFNDGIISERNKKEFIRFAIITFNEFSG